jgi:hypothetical protein
LFAWSAAAGREGGRLQLPWSVVFLMKFIAGQLEGEGRTAEVLPRGPDPGTVFRADAKAEGQLVVVGGWESIGGRAPGQARWFSATLNRKNAEWAFLRGEPFRSIASLELFATLLSILAFSDAWPSSSTAALRISGVTDNAGNTNVITRLMTSKFPLVVILAEVALQLQEKKVDMDLVWAPRDQNEEADAITNGEVSIFDPALKVELDLKDLRFKILPELMGQAQDLYQDVRSRRAKPSSEQAPRRGAKRPLRQTDPWS